jgi:outer membrane protein TolC
MPSIAALIAAQLLLLAAPRPQAEPAGGATGISRSPLSELRPPAPQQPDAGTVPLGEPEQKLELALEACVRAVLERNLGLRIAEIDNAAIETSVLQALGAFDPELYMTATGADAVQPTASTFQAPKNQSLNGSTGLRGLYRSGLSYDLDYSLAYNRQSPTNPFFGLNPTLSSNLAVSLTQPLLRGFGSTVTEAPVEQARLLVARGDFDLYQRVQDTAFAAVQAYWQLVGARRTRDTATEALAVAEELVTNNQKRKDAGVMTRLDVLTAQAEAARRREDLIRAQNGVGRAEDSLKLLLAPGDRLSAWRVSIEPTTPAGLREEALPPEEEVVVDAFAERSDLRALEVDVRAAELSLFVAENQELPRLDLLGSYGYGGLGGKQPGGDSKNNLDIWGNSLEQIRDRDFLTWSVGFDFSRPIGNRSAEATRRKAELDKQRAQMVWLERRMTVVQELRTSLRDAADAKAATEAAIQARILADEQYQAELIRLENQQSTTFQVREVQRDLFEAQDRETTAITQYEILLAAVERARGRLAKQYGVDWQPEERFEGELLE